MKWSSADALNPNDRCGTQTIIRTNCTLLRFFFFRSSVRSIFYYFRCNSCVWSCALRSVCVLVETEMGGVREMEVRVSGMWLFFAINIWFRLSTQNSVNFAIAAGENETMFIPLLLLLLSSLQLRVFWRAKYLLIAPNSRNSFNSI